MHFQRGGLQRLIYPYGLASVRAGKDQWDRPSLYITENNVDEIKNVSSNKKLLMLQGLIWECVQTPSLPCRGKEDPSFGWCCYVARTAESVLIQSLFFNNGLWQNQLVQSVNGSPKQTWPGSTIPFPE